MAREYLALLIPSFIMILVAILLIILVSHISCIDRCLDWYSVKNEEIIRMCCERCNVPYVPSPFRQIIAISFVIILFLAFFSEEINSLIKKIRGEKPID